MEELRTWLNRAAGPGTNEFLGWSRWEVTIRTVLHCLVALGKMLSWRQKRFPSFSPWSLLVPRSLQVLSAVLLCFFTSLATAAADDAYKIVVDDGKQADIVTPDGKPILRYMFERDRSTPERTFDTAKVFAHVVAPDGKETITKGAGGKFPHHRGIFIGWNRLQHDGKRHDLWHVRNTEQKHQAFLTKESTEDHATLTTKITWNGVDGEQLIEEKRTYRVISSDDAYAVIDFVSELTATAGDVRLDGDPEHAGVQFRPSQKVADNKSASYTFHKADVDPKKQRDLPWVAASFRIDDQTWTVQHMNHPSNPDGAVWSAYRDYGRFGPFAVIELKQGESQTLRFRFRVTPGDAPPREQMAEHYQAFAE